MSIYVSPEAALNVDLEFEKIVGMDELKAQLKVFFVSAKMNTVRRDRGQPVPLKRPNFTFKGNPGTGKTSVAQLVTRKCTQNHQR